MDNHGGQQPDSVRRYVRRGWWWFVASAATAGFVFWGDWDGANELDDVLSSGHRVEATVGGDYDGGEPIPLTYEHPTFGTTEAEVTTYTLDPQVAPGERIPVVADRVNPRIVELPGDEYGWVWPGLYLIAAVGLVPVMLRRRRIRPIAAGIGGEQGYVARIRHRTWPRRGMAVDLYPPDAAKGAKPVASVPLISSGGLPIGGEAFPVQVTGRPGRLRGVGVRTADDVLWPSRRALGPRLGRRRAFAGAVGEGSRPSPPQSLPPGRPTHGTWLRLLPALVLTGLGALVFLGTAAVVVPGYLDAEDFERDGVEVPAEVVGIEEGADELTVEYRPEGQERKLQTTVGVDFPEDWDVGDKTLAVVDPDDPTELRLLGNSYDAALPLFFAGLTVVPGAIWLVHDRRFVRRLRRRREGPWYAATILRSFDVSSFRPPYGSGVRLEIARPGAKIASAVVMVSGLRARKALSDLQRPITPPSEPSAPADSPASVAVAATGLEEPVPSWPSLEPPVGPAEAPTPPASKPAWESMSRSPVFGMTHAGPILVSGTPAPGEVILLRLGDTVILPAGPARAPARSGDSALLAVVDSWSGRPNEPMLVDVLDLLDGN